MAKLKAPLFSLTAHGSIGPRITFSRRSSGNQVRYQKAQTDYLNIPRLAQRVRFWAAVQWWKDLSDEEKAKWLRLGSYDC